MSFLIPPSSRPSLASFGYIPTGSFRADLRRRLFGSPNLLKRLQAPAIMRALALEKGHRALDFGCSSGYITVEMAKLCREAVGVDVLPFVETIGIPPQLKGRLRFIRASGASLPFPDAHFDVILASEVLPMLPDPGPFMREIRRILRPGGRLVVPNGTGPLPIRDAYDRHDPRLANLKARYPERFPATYDAYVREFQRIAGTARDDFLSEAAILDLLKQWGFRVVDVSYTPARRAGDWLAWRQFEYFLRTGQLVIEEGFVWRFLHLLWLSRGSQAGYSGGLLAVATRSETH